MQWTCVQIAAKKRERKPHYSCLKRTEHVKRYASHPVARSPRNKTQREKTGKKKGTRTKNNNGTQKAKVE